MAKITTIIDIGSNSMRMVVFQKTSRFAFHLLNETKSKVKISQGCYEFDGNLQDEPLQRAHDSLKSFLKISKALKSRKLICVATSALRDAPNAKDFINKVKNGLGIKIKIISGEKEAFYGGLAAVNLLQENYFFTMDIGGGSTEFCFVKNKEIEKSISLNIGTVRIKELFFSKNDINGAKEYILKEFQKIAKEISHIPTTCIGIGGTIRALSKVIMQNQNYPIDIIHGFSYDYEPQRKLFEKISNATSFEELKELKIKSDRFDTICEGAFIFTMFLDMLKTKRVVTSGAGVREGVYLNDLLRTSNCKFPTNYNLSMRSLLDRFDTSPKQSAYFGNNAKKIFETLKPLHNLDEKYRSILVVASKLHCIGKMINIYKSNEDGFDFIIDGLSYGYTHQTKATIAYLIKFSKGKLPHQKNIILHKELLPALEELQWLSFMISLNIVLNVDYSCTCYDYVLKDNTLKIGAKEMSYLLNAQI